MPRTLYLRSMPATESATAAIRSPRSWAPRDHARSSSVSTWVLSSVTAASPQDAAVATFVRWTRWAGTPGSPAQHRAVPGVPAARLRRGLRLGDEPAEQVHSGRIAERAIEGLGQL